MVELLREGLAGFRGASTVLTEPGRRTLHPESAERPSARPQGRAGTVNENTVCVAPDSDAIQSMPPRLRAQS